MKIDAHQHFWIYDPLRDAWINEEMKKIQRDFLPKDLLPILKENSFDGCIAVQADPSENETGFLLSLAGNYNFIKGVVGWVDLCSPDVAQKLEHYSQFKLLKGFRHILQSEPEEFLLRDDFARGIGALKKYGFTYDILVYPRHLPAVLELIKKFPEQKFIIDHLAKPPIKDAQIDRWASDLETISQHENVYCKVSGMVTEASWRSWTYNDLVPYLEVVTDCFGTGRLVYGSDWPVCLVAGSYRDQLEPVEKYFKTFLDKEQQMIFGGNAEVFYGL